MFAGEGNTVTGEGSAFGVSVTERTDRVFQPCLKTSSRVHNSVPVYSANDQVYVTNDQVYVTNDQVYVTNDQVYVTNDQVYVTNNQIYATND